MQSTIRAVTALGAVVVLAALGACDRQAKISPSTPQKADGKDPMQQRSGDPI